MHCDLMFITRLRITHDCLREAHESIKSQVDLVARPRHHGQNQRIRQVGGMYGIPLTLEIFEAPCECSFVLATRTSMEHAWRDYLRPPLRSAWTCGLMVWSGTRKDPGSSAGTDLARQDGWRQFPEFETTVRFRSGRGSALHGLWKSYRMRWRALCGLVRFVGRIIAPDKNELFVNQTSPNLLRRSR